MQYPVLENQKTQRVVYVPVQQQQVVYQQVAAPVKRKVTRPLTLDEKIAITKDDVEFEAKRIWVCSLIFLLCGMIAVVRGFYEVFDARLKAAFIYQEHQMPWGNANYTNFTALNITKPTSGIPRVEEMAFDNIRNMSFLIVIVGMLLMVMAGQGFRATSTLKARVSQKMFQGLFATFLFFLIFFVFYRKQKREFEGVYSYIVNNTTDNATFINTVQTEAMEPAQTIETPKRMLAGLLGKTSDECKAAYKTSATCNADADCIWCEAGAVRPACYNVDDAKRLPPGVFNCPAKTTEQEDEADLDEEEEVDMVDLKDEAMQMFNHMQARFFNMSKQMGFDMDRMMTKGKKDFKKGQKGRGHRKGMKGGKRGRKERRQDLAADDFDAEDRNTLDYRSQIFKIYAPGLYERAMRQERQQAGRHPRVMADRNVEEGLPSVSLKDPIFALLTVIAIHQLFRIKFLEKTLARLEFLKKAKKVAKAKMEKIQQAQAEVEAPVQQPVQQVFVAAQPAQVVTMPVTQKVCKQVIKKVAVADAESAPVIAEGFNYNMSEPLVESQIVEETASSTLTSKNSMM